MLDFPGGSDGQESAAVRETWVPSLGGEDALEEGRATHCSVLAWRISRAEEPAGYSPWGRREPDTPERKRTVLGLPAAQGFPHVVLSSVQLFSSLRCLGAAF